MGLRASMNEHPVWTASIAVVLVVGAIVLIISGPGNAGSSEAVAGASGLSWYTTDDGATWFSAGLENYPPFKKDGKDAVRAYVYRDANGKEFVSHLERYTAAAKRALDAYAKQPPEVRATEDPNTVAGDAEGIEVKRPKDTTWIRASHPKAQEIMTPRSPEGTTSGLTYVTPR